MAFDQSTQIHTGERVATIHYGQPVEATLRRKGISGDFWLVQLDDGECFWAGYETCKKLGIELANPDRARAERLEAAALEDYYESTEG